VQPAVDQLVVQHLAGHLVGQHGGVKAIGQVVRHRHHGQGNLLACGLRGGGLDPTPGLMMEIRFLGRFHENAVHASAYIIGLNASRKPGRSGGTL
jgi:hypothetical protein